MRKARERSTQRSVALINSMGSESNLKITGRLVSNHRRTSQRKPRECIPGQQDLRSELLHDSTRTYSPKLTSVQERAAWEFVAKEKPSFDLTVINPPLVLGPIAHRLASLSALNTSNERIRDLITGASRDRCPPTGNYGYVDVRDLALAHVLAIEKPEAGGQRFFTVSSHFSNKEIAEIIGQEFPEFRDRLPSGDGLAPGDYPADGVYGFDNSRSRQVLGMQYRTLRESIVDAVNSLLAVEPEIAK